MLELSLQLIKSEFPIELPRPSFRVNQVFIVQSEDHFKSQIDIIHFQIRCKFEMPKNSSEYDFHWDHCITMAYKIEKYFQMPWNKWKYLTNRCNCVDQHWMEWMKMDPVFEYYLSKIDSDWIGRHQHPKYLFSSNGNK